MPNATRMLQLFIIVIGKEMVTLPFPTNILNNGFSR